MRTKIQNSDDLRTEILRLRTVRYGMENDLKDETNRISAKFRAPLMLFSKLNDWFGPFRKTNRNDPDSQDHDWVTSIFRVGLPVVMNKFIFPKSGFLLRSIVELLSQNTAKTVNKDVLSDLINKFSEWIKSSKRTKNRGPEMADYGIPPDSETY